MATDPTNLVGDGDTSATDTAIVDTGVTADDQTNADESQLDEHGNPVAVDDDEEFDLGDDLKLRVPKTAAQKLKELQEGSLRQADYTRKTQSHAENVRAFEAKVQQFEQASQQERDADAALRVINAQLTNYQNVNWAGLMQQARANYDDDRVAMLQQEHMQFTQLQQAKANAEGAYNSAKTAREAQLQQETAKQIEEGRAAVAKIPGWSEQAASELKAIATSPEIGFTADEIGDEITINPKVARALLLAKEGLQARRNAAKAQSHVAAQQVQPAARAGGGSSAPPSGLDDRLSPEEWVRRRNAQVKKRA